ncbi:response regulator transcription factor [Micromonospora aurantiaca]|uniref:response regulator transcription factor n=1 Tax=Micromonospora aurantiaca (nom. illeg.) TaxID=47850 RepID=UPI0037B777A0
MLVDGDVRSAQSLVTALEVRGFLMSHAPTARSAMAMPAHDLLLIRMILPDASGISFCQSVRARLGIPIIMLSDKPCELDVVTSLHSGADDYVARPFSLAELHARIEAVLRRCAHAPTASQVFGNLRLSVDEHCAYIGEGAVPLTAKELRILSLLIRIPGAVVGRRNIMEGVWGSCDRSVSRTLESHVSSLRLKISSAARIEALRGVGYRLVGLTGQEGAACA